MTPPAGLRRRTMTFTSWLAPYVIATVRAASQRRVTAAIANQIAPCSPRRENRATLETDAVILGLDAQVDDLRQVERDVRVAGIHVVEALVALDRLAQAFEDGLVEPQPGEHLAAGEP